MVTLYVWKRLGNSPGHVALSFSSNYVSVWPSREDAVLKDMVKNTPKGNVKDFTIGATHAPRLSKGYKIDRSIMDRDATLRIELPKMDIAAMSIKWNEYKVNPTRFNTRKSNCSTLVAAFLELGSGVTYSSVPSVRIQDYTTSRFRQVAFQLRFMGNTVNMWSPEDVHRYAVQIKNQLG